MPNANPNPMPNLAEPRIGITEANPEGVGVFFAVMRTAIAKCDWKRSDFEKVQEAEGMLIAAEKHFEAAREVAKPAAPAAAVSDLPANLAPPAAPVAPKGKTLTEAIDTPPAAPVATPPAPAVKPAPVATPPVTPNAADPVGTPTPAVPAVPATPAPAAEKKN